MSGESFAELFQASIKKSKVYPGAVVTGIVVGISDDYVTINAGLKSEGYIPVNQFLNEKGEMEVAIDDEVEVEVVDYDPQTDLPLAHSSLYTNQTHPGLQPRTWFSPPPTHELI